jgi:uncharacterized membrane protein YhaH (DUF805 family)
MKSFLTAALLSAFVFPGVGHLYLKQTRRGLVIFLLALGSVVFLIGSLALTAIRLLDRIAADSGGASPELKRISELVVSQGVVATPWQSAVFYLLVGVWLFAIVDVIRLAKKNGPRTGSLPSGDGGTHTPDGRETDS